jgi:hypothetical protein
MNGSILGRKERKKEEESALTRVSRQDNLKGLDVASTEVIREERTRQ